MWESPIFRVVFKTQEETMGCGETRSVCGVLAVREQILYRVVEYND